MQPVCGRQLKPGSHQPSPAQAGEHVYERRRANTYDNGRRWPRLRGCRTIADCADHRSQHAHEVDDGGARRTAPGSEAAGSSWSSCGTAAGVRTAHLRWSGVLGHQKNSSPRLGSLPMATNLTMCNVAAQTLQRGQRGCSGIPRSVRNQLRDLDDRRRHIRHRRNGGTAGATGDGGKATSADLNGPEGVALDTAH